MRGSFVRKDIIGSGNQHSGPNASFQIFCRDSETKRYPLIPEDRGCANALSTFVKGSTPADADYYVPLGESLESMSLGIHS